MNYVKICIKVNLHRLNNLSVNPRGEDEGVGFLVVTSAEHADVLHLSLVVVFVDALQHFHVQFPVSDCNAEEFGFEGVEIFLVPLLGKQPLILAFLHLPVPPPLHLGAFPLPFGFNAPMCIVVGRDEIFGTDVLGVAEVLAECAEHTEIVAPHWEIVDFVMVALGDKIGSPNIV